MLIRRMICSSGVLMFMIALAMAVPGCGGGGGQTTGPGGEVKIEPPVNAKPGVGSVQDEYKTAK
jgi:hypothetical protein